MMLLTLLLLPQTAEILSVMQWRMANTDSFRLLADIEYQGWVTREDSQRDRESVGVKISSWIDRTDEELTRQRHIFRFLIGPQISGNESIYRFEGEERSLGDANFLRLDRIPQQLGGVRLDRFVGRWLRIEKQDIAKRIDLPVIGGGRDLTDEDSQYLLEQFRQTPFFTVQQRLKDEVVGGANTFHYTIKPELSFFKDFFVTSETVRKGRELTSDERRIVDRFFSNVQAETGEIWIGHSDYYLYRLFLRFNYNDGLRDGSLSLTLTFSDFNQPYQIADPEGEVQDVSQIIESLLPSFVNKLPLANIGGQNLINSGDGSRGGLSVSVTTIQAEDPDRDGLNNYLEFFYGSDPNNPDTDGDGMLDGAEVIGGRNPTGPGRLFDFGLSEALNRDEEASESKINEIKAKTADIEALDTGTTAENSNSSAQ